MLGKYAIYLLNLYSICLSLYKTKCCHVGVNTCSRLYVARTTCNKQLEDFCRNFKPGVAAKNETIGPLAGIEPAILMQCFNQLS